ncbi:MAG: hypothetical protein ABI675_24560 [Chitinophagaceae bacterium]
MRYILLGCCSVFFTLACNDQGKKIDTQPALVKEIKSDSASPRTTVVASDSVPKNIQIDSVIHLAFARDSISVTVKGHLDKKGDPVICYLPVTKGKKLTASITPEKAKANIRFSYIFLPNGKSDGPFSPSMKYDLVQRGVYKIYISPNKMAGDPISTDFTLKVKVE